MPVAVNEYNQTVQDVVTVGLTEQTVQTISVAAASCGMLRLTVLARDTANDNARSWELAVHFRRDTDGDPSVTGVLQALLDQGSLGAASWLVSVTFSGSSLAVKVTGALGRTIDWVVFFSARWMEKT